MKKIFKTIILVFLLIINIALSITFFSFEKYFDDKNIIFNLSTISLQAPLKTQQEQNKNKFSLIYFYDPSSLQTEKYNTIKNFTDNIDTQKVLNFVDFSLDGTNEEDFVIYTNIARNKGSNTIVLLDKYGYTISVFEPTLAVSKIEDFLKDTLKNYI